MCKSHPLVILCLVTTLFLNVVSDGAAGEHALHGTGEVKSLALGVRIHPPLFSLRCISVELLFLMQLQSPLQREQDPHIQQQQQQQQHSTTRHPEAGQTHHHWEWDHGASVTHLHSAVK